MSVIIWGISIQPFDTVLASSMKLRYPLTDVLPNTEHARDRLLAKMFMYRRDHEGTGGVLDEDFALLYAYGAYCSSSL